MEKYRKEYTYQNTGVDLKSADILSKLLAMHLKSDNFNDFAGTFAHPALPGFRLVATTDGIGTKIMSLVERKMFNTMAQDLVAMNLNDLICAGAKPLFFLDYLAVHKLEPEILSGFIEELNNLLCRYDCALLGGETSEMPDFIKENVFDAAGFMVGLVKEDEIPNRQNISAGDIVIGLKSSGIHSNGFSLVRKLYADRKLNDEEFIKTLAPTEIYAESILKICAEKLVLGLANITGGGILSNIKRAVPNGFCAVLDKTSLPKLPVFNLLSHFVAEDEMYRTFNMGAGFCIIAKQKNVQRVLEIAKNHNPFIFGYIEKSETAAGARFND